MIPLRGRSVAVAVRRPLERNLWMIADSDTASARGDRAVVVEAGRQPPDGFGLYLGGPGTSSMAAQHDWVELPAELGYLGPGDVLAVSSDGWRLHVVWRNASRQNSVLLTERCDNHCLMCSQPPKEAADGWLLERASELVGLLPQETGGIIFTGGEPTLYGDGFIGLMKLCKQALPDTDVHVLSNGRRFADPAFAVSYAAVDNPRLMVGIPIYGAEPSLHDYVVQAPGAFDETVGGILNLARLDQRVEVRVVLHKETAPAIVEIAEFISRNLPFVEQVALMGLEMMGLARGNVADVWIDPFDYKDELAEAALLLHVGGIKTMIYNHQLCLLDPRVWPLAVKSISDWKNEFAPACCSCGVVEECGGFFHSAQYKSSAHIRPVALARSARSRSVDGWWDAAATGLTRVSDAAAPP